MMKGRQQSYRISRVGGDSGRRPGRDGALARRRSRANFSLMSTAAPHHAAPRRMSLEEWASLPEDEPGELVCTPKGTIDVPGCEGLRLDLDAMWAYADGAREG